MKEKPLQWLTERVARPGTLACALRRPDGQFVCHSADATCPAATIEKIIGYFDTLAAAVFTEAPAPRWSTWSFEQGQIRFVDRPDGWRLALVVRADTPSALDLLSQEFFELQFKD